MIQLQITSFFKTTLKKRKRRGKFTQSPKKENILIQKLITDFWHEFSDIATLDLYGLFTPYRNKEQFWMAFLGRIIINNSLQKTNLESV